MQLMFKAGFLALTLLAVPAIAQAGTLEGVAIGAGSGALVAGPPGAIVGGVVGAVVGGPDIRRPRTHARAHRTCWRDRNGYRRCGWR
jgi:hypothetical protein